MFSKRYESTGQLVSLLKNLLKERLKRGETLIGTFVGLGHPDVTEWLSRLGFDWLLLDAEHGPMDFETLQSMMQSMTGSSCIPVVRPQWNDPVIIKRILDIGAYGVLVPWVNSKEEAEAAVRACRYPPEGVRGWGPRRAGMFDPDYFKSANEEILVAVQIETEKALRNIDEILSVGGVDACYIGPNDLSCSLGFGMPPRWDEPRYLEAFDKVLMAVEKCGKSAGMFATIENIGWAVEKGFRFNTVDSADTFLIRGARAALEKARRSV
jgi:2-keto-3-deoxy-L-rhamnonate aldolase RhmA